MEPIKSYLYKNKLRKLKQAKVKEPFQVQKAKNIGIIFNASELDVREKVVSFSQKLLKDGFHVKMLGYLNQKTESITFPFDYFTIKDVNFYDVPKNEHVAHFLGRDFDILMNLDLTDNKALHYLAAAAKATFKVGPPSPEHDHYHLMIETNDKNKLEGFILEMRKTLNKIA